MNKLFILIILLGIASVASYGTLASQFDLIMQKIGIFKYDSTNQIVACTCLPDIPESEAACLAAVAANPVCPHP